MTYSRERFGHVRRLPGFTADFFEIRVSEADLGPSEIFAASEVQSILPLTKEEALAGMSTAFPVSAAAQQPTIGRIVHFLQIGDRGEVAPSPVAAIITGVFEAGDGDDICTLTVFEPGEPPRPLPEAVRHGIAPGHWRFPPIQPV
ncbi:hypothetical protein [Methylobacterium sp. Leaf85]|uniref:hypothetical protein n=1 Tax=Methylobacterium sp. Leaf85 TaxID=1736241 RepID=UPI0012E862CD|nr:hypothetical protein [Methylobacterium sp. Leaf85]